MHVQMHYNSGIFAQRNDQGPFVCKKHHQWTNCSFASGLLIDFLMEIKPVTTTYYILLQKKWFSATYPFLSKISFLQIFLYSFSLKQGQPTTNQWNMLLSSLKNHLFCLNFQWMDVTRGNHQQISTAYEFIWLCLEMEYQWFCWEIRG